MLLECKAEDLIQLEHLHIALLHLQNEVVVVRLRRVHPQHVIEQQLVAVPGRQALMRQAGRQTSTVRKIPTSEWTPQLRMVTPYLPGVAN